MRWQLWLTLLPSPRRPFLRIRFSLPGVHWQFVLKMCRWQLKRENRKLLRRPRSQIMPARDNLQKTSRCDKKAYSFWGEIIINLDILRLGQKIIRNWKDNPAAVKVCLPKNRSKKTIDKENE